MIIYTDTKIVYWYRITLPIIPVAFRFFSDLLQVIYQDLRVEGGHQDAGHHEHHWRGQRELTSRRGQVTSDWTGMDGGHVKKSAENCGVNRPMGFYGVYEWTKTRALLRREGWRDGQNAEFPVVIQDGTPRIAFCCLTNGLIMVVYKPTYNWGGTIL